MVTAESGKCRNCGADLEPEINSTRKCAYCGSVFTTASTAQPQANAHPVSNNPVTNKVPAPWERSSSGDGMAKILFISIFAIIFLVVALTPKGWTPLSNNGASSTATDSAAIDTTTKSSSFEEDEESKQKHLKRTNPEQQVLLKHLKVYTNKNLTIISVTFQNKTDPYKYVEYVEFSFLLFDKNGKELKTGDSNIRRDYVRLEKGKIKSDEWSIVNRLPEAKKIKVKLNKVGFEDEVWDY